MNTITVIKNDHTGREVWRYEGRLLTRGATWVNLEAVFTRPDLHTPYYTIRQGDRFVEWFYSDRWYSLFEMHDVDDGHLTGWYCNVNRPAVLAVDTITTDDLALDLFVTPSGAITLLDEDEFAALPLDETTRAQARRAVNEITRLVEARQPPFNGITPG